MMMADFPHFPCLFAGSPSSRGDAHGGVRGNSSTFHGAKIQSMEPNGAPSLQSVAPAKRRPLRGAAKQSSVLARDLELRVWKLMEQGERPKAIASQLGLARQSVHRIAKRVDDAYRRTLSPSSIESKRSKLCAWSLSPMRRWPLGAAASGRTPKRSLSSGLPVTSERASSLRPRQDARQSGIFARGHGSASRDPADLRRWDGWERAPPTSNGVNIGIGIKDRNGKPTVISGCYGGRPPSWG